MSSSNGNPYRTSVQSSEQQKGSWLYGNKEECPYCGLKTKLYFSREEVKYKSDNFLFGEVCRPAKKLHFLKKRRWYGDLYEACPEPGHHIHVWCSKCKAVWLFEIIPTRASTA